MPKLDTSPKPLLRIFSFILSFALIYERGGRGKLASFVRLRVYDVMTGAVTAIPRKPDTSEVESQMISFAIPVVFNKLIRVQCMFLSNTTYFI